MYSFLISHKNLHFLNKSIFEHSICVGINTLLKKINSFKKLQFMVPSAGLEPALPKRARILSPLCLPIPPRGL